jgi:choline dehydrogenase
MEFDYVIVGGGSAGCVLAGRLSEDPDVSVCLLEAGGPDDSVLIHAPLGFAAGAPVGLNTSLFETVPQRGLNGRKGFQPRGRVLGGSSSINAMMYVRGHPSDYDGWAAQGNPGWDFASVLPYFKRSENSEATGANDHRGMGGPLNVALLRSPSPLNDAFLAACEQSGLARTPDYNGARQEGCWPVQVTQVGGERCSAAKAYLTPHLSRPNLQVITRAQASKIELTGRRATAVHFLHGRVPRRVAARREVILAGGAYGSPQLLMLSGIGRGSDLQGHGLAVQHDLPGVGQGLQDHITATLIWRTASANQTLGLSAAGGWRLLKGMREWRQQRSGVITSNVAESGAFLRTRPDLLAPDIELEFIVAMVDNHNRKLHLGHGYSLHITLMRPRSRGQVTLAGLGARQPLHIDPGFFSHPDDMAQLVAGTQRAMAIMQAAALAPHRGELLYPVNAQDPVDVERHIRRTADTEYHPVSTCRMGPASDPLAVVGPDLRVHGLEALRVVDASIMPSVTTGNTNGPTIMVAEKAADLIRGRTLPPLNLPTDNNRRPQP